MARLSQTNPELFDNETLGEATTTPFLDQVEAQKVEDFNARYEGREPRNVVAIGRIPGKFKPSGSVPSDYSDEIAFADEYETPVDETPVDEETPTYDYDSNDNE